VYPDNAPMYAGGAALLLVMNVSESFCDICAAASPLTMLRRVGIMNIARMYVSPQVLVLSVLIDSVEVTNTIISAIAVVIFALMGEWMSVSGDLPCVRRYDNRLEHTIAESNSTCCIIIIL
jgi:phage-related holin